MVCQVVMFCWWRVCHFCMVFFDRGYAGDGNGGECDFGVTKVVVSLL